jgi:hypothetical protein
VGGGVRLFGEYDNDPENVFTGKKNEKKNEIKEKT